MRMFPNDDTARSWLETQMWPNGSCCPHCGSFNVQRDIRHRIMSHRCRDCPNRPQFSLKTGTVMKGTKLEYRDWAIVIYLLTTNLQGVSSKMLHRDLEITHLGAWHLMHWLCSAFENGAETDATYLGGNRMTGKRVRYRDLVA